MQDLDFGDGFTTVSDDHRDIDHDPATVMDRHEGVSGQCGPVPRLPPDPQTTNWNLTTRSAHLPYWLSPGQLASALLRPHAWASAVPPWDRCQGNRSAKGAHRVGEPVHPHHPTVRHLGQSHR